MITIVQKYIEVRQRRECERNSELLETVFKRWIGLAFKAHEEWQYFDNDAVGQKGRLRFILNIFRKKRKRPFWPAKQVDNAYQHSTEGALRIRQKGLPGKV